MHWQAMRWCRTVGRRISAVHRVAAAVSGTRRLRCDSCGRPCFMMDLVAICVAGTARVAVAMQLLHHETPTLPGGLCLCCTFGRPWSAQTDKRFGLYLTHCNRWVWPGILFHSNVNNARCSTLAPNQPAEYGLSKSKQPSRCVADFAVR
jgi:hypothetical protein